MRKIVIIGNGISGVTAARNIRKKTNDEILIISSETDHFFSRTALMYIYMGHMKYEHTKPYEDHFWEKNRIDLKRDFVQHVDSDNKRLSLSSGGSVAYDKLIIACGSKPNKFGWPGQDLPGVQGLYSMQDLELLEQNTHPHNTPKQRQKVNRAIIVGGGLIGVELAEMLITRGIHVTFLIREKRFWGNVLPEGDGLLIANHLKEHGVELRFSTELKEINAGDDGRVERITTTSGEEISCELVGLTPGVSPNIDFLKDSKINTERGVIVNRFLETNIPDVYAIGDCAQFSEPATGRRPIEQVWYTGRMMGETLAKTIAGERTMYEPGHWFNSAKFFDIEYQTYGLVFSELRDGEDMFHWHCEKYRHCLSVVYEKESMQFLGLNIFGIRLRHEMMDRWLTEKRDVYFVLEHLASANFDPELYKSWEKEILIAAEDHFKKSLKVEPIKPRLIF